MIVHGNRRAFLERHCGRQAVSQRCRNRNPAGVRVEMREGCDSVARTQRLGLFHFSLSAFHHLFNNSGDFDPRDEWRFRRAGINPHPLQEVGKVDADGFHANQYFTRFWVRVGHFLRLKNFRGPVPPYDHCAHLISFKRFSANLGCSCNRRGEKLTPAFYLGMYASYLKLLDFA